MSITADLDEPEPSLALLGPPAVTRRMVELWTADCRVRARFDLKEPLQRRDYALWLGREGRALGLDQRSIGAALALTRRGAGLQRPPPRWPPQSAQNMPADTSLDIWLGEAIAWEFGRAPIGVPMPRALALLWELRQDVRLHFANRTPAEALEYLAWCLTQAVHDGCVAVGLVGPALGGFLDTPVAEFDRDGPPVTRLLQMMAPLYDGPFADVARDFPHTRAARLSVAIWVCGSLRRRYGWPECFLHRPLHWLSRPAPCADAFVALDNLLVGLWELCPALQGRCDITVHEGRSLLLDWFVSGGARRFGFESRTLPAQRCLPAAKPPSRRDLCLVGYAGLVSGRAEDLQMTALALRRQSRQYATLDRLSAAITNEDGRAVAAWTQPPRISLLHLNADTAFFDYLFLREQGMGQSYAIGYWAWELAKFPEEWTSSFDFVHEVWVSSRFAYEAIAPATTKPVLLMPMPVALPHPERGVRRADFGLPNRDFVFYFSFDFRSYSSRKNPLAIVAAFRQAFPRRSAAVALVLKTIGSAWKPLDRDRLVQAIGSDPRIVLIDEELPRPRAIALLALSDCFVSLHRCEGFGRGPAEAMLLGKPVIATDYSGTCDYATHQTALLVGYELVPVAAEEYPGADGQVWAEPDTAAAAAAMRRVYDDPDLARRLGRAGRAHVSTLYDPTTVGAAYLQRIDAILKAS